MIPINLETLATESKYDGKKFGLVPLHLKSICSMCGPDHILLGGSLGLALLQFIRKYSTFTSSTGSCRYNLTTLPVTEAANVIWINSYLLRRSDDEFPECKDIFAALPYQQIQLRNSELCKVDGALTCCSLLLE